MCAPHGILYSSMELVNFRKKAIGIIKEKLQMPGHFSLEKK